MSTLLLPVIIPALAALVIAFLPKKWPMREVFTVLVAAFNAILVWSLFNKEMNLVFPWGGAWGMEFSFRLYGFSSFILLATGIVVLLISLYSTSYMKDKEHVSQFYAYLLLTLAQLNGVVLSNNLILLLFFWEGLLLTLFAFIAIGRKEAMATAVKAFVINGATDLCMMAGVILTGYLAGTFTISEISLQTNGLASLAFVLLIIGAISKAGSMPFHTWIPDAAIDAPLPFMAFGPGSFEKLVGIYFLARICLDMFKLSMDSWLSTMLMIIGAVTIFLAVMMALVQKDYKKLLSYHAISQVGYMILGIGTMLPIGIIGGLFHMLNNAIYKDCLFMTGGAVEKQTGTTDLYKLGGLGSKMPITFACFTVAALSISGVPFFNGFFSKELIYDGALERGIIFYIAAAGGSFLTAASFLKLGHSAYLGKVGERSKDVKGDVPLMMLLPMIFFAALCIFFGVYSAYPINAFFTPVLGASAAGHHFSGMPANITLVIITIVVLVLAYLNHRYGVKKYGTGIKAVDHIHHAPVLNKIYDMAEKKYFDPYDIGLKFIRLFSKVSFAIDRAIDWFYNRFTVKTTYAVSGGIRKAHTGNYSIYLVWSLAGAVLLVIWILRTVR